jgi:hypothetical protein
VTRQAPGAGRPVVADGERATLIATRADAATSGPWGYLRASGAIWATDGGGRLALAADGVEVAQCLHDPDAEFIAHAREDVPWLLGQLAAEQHALAALERRLAVLVAGVGRANEALDRLPWEGDGLLHLVAEGVASAEVVAAVHAAAGALDPEALGLKVDHADEGVRS